MNKTIQKTLVNRLLVSAILIPHSLFAASPWNVSDGTKLEVDSGYRSTTKGDHALHAAGQDSHLSVNDTLSFLTTSDNTHGAYIINGAKASITGSTLSTQGSSAHGAYLYNATLHAQDSNFITEGVMGRGIYAENGSEVNISGGTINATGSLFHEAINIDKGKLNAENVVISHSGLGNAITLDGNSQGILNNVTITMHHPDTLSGLKLGHGNMVADGLNIFTAGNNGIYVYNPNDSTSGHAIINNSSVTAGNGNAVMALNGKVTLNNVNALTKGETIGSHAVNANRNGQVVINQSRFVTTAKLSDAVIVYDKQASIEATSSHFLTHGDNSFAFNVREGYGLATNSQLETKGEHSYGIYSESQFTGNQLQIATIGTQSFGTVAARGGVAELTDSNINTSGNTAAGLLVFPRSTINGQQLNVATSGDNASGLYAISGTINLANSAIQTSGVDANGVYVQGAGNNQITLDNVQLVSQQASVVRNNASMLDLLLQNGTTLNSGINQLFDTPPEKITRADPTSTSNIVADNNVTLNGDLQGSNNHIVTLRLNNHSSLNGATQGVKSISIDPSSQWNITGNANVGQLNLAGNANFQPTTNFSTLSVQDYQGNNGRLLFNAQLHDDNTLSDKLVINGNSSGTTYVAVQNRGGTGEYTNNGIALIQVNGVSDGEFIQDGRIVAGGFEYTLGRGRDDNAAHWYLFNDRPTITPPPDNGNPSIPSPPNVERGGPVLRPEIGAYLANLNAANTLFAMSLHDRQGDTQFTDIFTGEQKVTSMWLRQQGGHSRFRDNSGQIKTQGNRYMVQLGGDIAQWSSNPQDRWHLGIMAGYGTQHSNSHSSISHYRADGAIHGYSLGSYATWYHNEQEKTGGYVDSWLQYQWFKNSVKGDKLAVETYRSKGISASLEVGYSAKIAESTGSLGSVNQWFIQPKVQTLWKGVKAHDHQEATSTQVQAPGKGHAETRIAVRAYLKGQHKKDRNSHRVFQPFAELSWIHAYNTDIKMDGTAYQLAGQNNLAEIKAGVESQLGKELTSWGHVKHQIGNNGYSDSSVMLGVKYHF